MIMHDWYVTDLNWNTLRYLQHCEGVRSDVTHLSFQLMPYPWFKKQQAPLFPSVRFPAPFNGVSTNRASEGNAMLVHKFLSLNLKSFMTSSSTTTTTMQSDSRLFIDMQSVNDVEIGSGGQWRGFTLIPYGYLYKVMMMIMTHLMMDKPIEHDEYRRR